MTKKIISYVLVVAMLLSGVSAYLQFGTDKTDKVGAAQQQQMKMPIVIYDHLNDTLLFEYLNTDTSFGLTMYVDTPSGVANENSGKNLVEDELGPNGTPVYKKEVVERVAQIVKDTIEQVRTDANYDTRTDVSGLYRKITNMVLTENPKETKIEVNEGGQIFNTLEDIGWTFEKGVSSRVEGNRNNVYDSNENVLWYQEGDQLHATSKDSENTATCELGVLSAGTYRLYGWAVNDLDVTITTPTGTENVTFEEKGETDSGANRPGKVYEFTLEEDSIVSVTLSPKNGADPAVMPFYLLKKDGEQWNKEKDLLDRSGNVSATKLGWVVEDGSSWRVYQGGGITCDNDEETSAYKEVNVTPGETYRFKNGMNDNGICKVWVEDENGNVLISKLPTQYNESGTSLDDRKATITIPNGVNKVRVYVANDSSKEGTRRVGEIYMKQLAKANLGDYETSKAKYDGGAKLDDITSCMDYAYYFLNSFWSDTNGDITQKTDLYQTLTLDLLNNSDKYRFSNGQKINYDLDNKNIHQDLNTAGTTGLFPLDSAVLGDRSDLSAPFGVADGELTNEKHNYHYGMKAHCQFVYDTSSDLEFNFSGDDDVYLFINGKKAMDIGGAHGAVSGSVVLNYNAKSGNDSEVAKDNASKQLAESLGLVEGQIYDFDFFYLERHTSLSNIRIETNMPLVQAGVTPKVTFKDKDGNEIPDGSKVQAGETVGVEYNITSTTKINPNAPNKLTDLEIVDNELGVQIGYFGNNYPTLNLGNAYVDDAITVTVKDKDGQVTKTFSIAANDLYNDDKVREFVTALKNVQLDNQESVTISGIKRKMPADEILKSELDVHVVAPEPYFDNSGHIQFKNNEVTTLPVDGKLIPVNDPDIKVTGVLQDKDGKVLNKDDEGKYKDEYLPKGTEIYPVFTITTDAGQMTDIKLDDSNGTGFVLDKDGVKDPNGFLGENDTLVVTYKPADGEELVLNIPKRDIEYQNESFLMLRELLNGGISLNKGDQLIISGLHKALDTNPIETKPSASAFGVVPTYNEETGELSTADKEVSDTDSKKKAIPTVEARFLNGTNGTIEGDTEQTVVCNGSVDSVPVKKTSDPGYSFVGWKIVDSQDDTVYTSEQVAAMQLTDDTAFVAQWELGKVTVVFKAGNNGSVTGTDAEKSQTFDYGDKVETVPGTSADTGHEFKGWKRKSDDKIYTADEIKDLVFTEDDEFEAVFDPIKLNVTYQAGNNGSIDGDEGEEVSYGSNPENVPEPKADKGYKFAGWTKKVTGGDSSVDDPKDETITEDTVFEAVFVPVHSNYIVKYVDENGKEIFTAKPGEETQVGTIVTEKAVNVNGYELISADTVELEIAEGDENVIVFKYRKIEETTTETEEETTVKEKTKKEKTSKKTKKKKKTKEETTKEQTTTPNQTQTGTSNTSLISPKTGHGNQLMVILMMLFVSVLTGGIAFRKMKED